jgi:L-asparagine transporter-like permease
LIPLLIGIGASDASQYEWDAGFFTRVSGEVAGPWLAAWTVLAAAVSNIGLYEAELSGDAYQLMGMADRGLIPKVFSKRSRFGTPTNGILVGTFVIFCLGVAEFDALVEMLNFAYAIALLMEFAAFIKLRITDSDGKYSTQTILLVLSKCNCSSHIFRLILFAFIVERPFRIPFNTLGCCLFIAPACAICLFVMVSASKVTYIYFVILVTFGLVFHFIQKMAKHYNLWEYAEAPPKKTRRSGLTPSSTPTNNNSTTPTNNGITNSNGNNNINVS